MVISGPPPWGRLHDEDQPCPFADCTHPRAAPEGCCSFDARNLYDTLTNSSQEDVAAVVWRPMTSKQALAVADVSQQVATAYEQDAELRRQAEVARARGERDDLFDIDLFSPEEMAEMITTLRQGAHWLRVVGERGLGVTSI
ncbi:MAG: hypothetical protein ACHREM_25745 [Polyangiales bacterium]